MNEMGAMPFNYSDHLQLCYIEELHLSGTLLIYYPDGENLIQNSPAVKKVCRNVATLCHMYIRTCFLYSDSFFAPVVILICLFPPLFIGIVFKMLHFIHSMLAYLIINA